MNDDTRSRPSHAEPAAPADDAPGDSLHAAGRLGAALLRSWFALTAAEQRALALVAALFILGTLARCWRALR